MKRKGARDIPDFSSKRKKDLHGTTPAPRQPASAPMPRERVIKPQSTSSKSGRRGS